jgi:3-methyladenine DNA glycosylase AlkD
MTTLTQLITELENIGDPDRRKNLQRYFKTGKGEYGEGDIFLGLTVGDQRKIARKYRHLSLEDVTELLQNKIHEHRLVALLILVDKFGRGDQSKRKEIVELYLNNTKWINNWDLVDLSAHKILGEYYLDKPKNVLYELAESDNLWEKRISIISTFTFIRNESYKESLKIAEMLVNDDHDLIHKGVGWMLREIGKRDQAIEEEFLMKHHKTMPRTMLRYSIEKFEKEKKQFYMKK